MASDAGDGVDTPDVTPDADAAETDPGEDSGLPEGDGETVDDGSDLDCQYPEMVAECEPRDWPYPEMPHVDCGDGAREVYLEHGLSSRDYPVEVWGDAGLFMDHWRLMAIDLGTMESRLVECERSPVRVGPGEYASRDYISAVSMAQSGLAGLLWRTVWDVENYRCDKRIEFHLLDWTTGGDRLLRVEYDDLPDDEGWPCSAGMIPMSMDAWGDTGVIGMIGHDCHAGVYTIDLVTGDLTKHVDLGFPPVFVSIWGERVAYSTTSEVFLLDLRTGERRNLSNHPADQAEPDIWEDRVVWMDHRNSPGGYDSPGNFDIYWYDLSTDELHAASTRERSQRSPRIFGDIIVYDSIETDGNRIWMYDIRTGEERQLTFAAGSQFLKDLFGSNVYYEIEVYVPGDPAGRWAACELAIDGI